MKLKNIFALCVGAAFCAGSATLAAHWIEARSADVVRAELNAGDHEWTELSTDGLRVILEGTAPDEATRFRVVTTVGRVVDPDRIVDLMEVAARSEIAPPRFTVEILRNADGVSLIGLVPATTDRVELNAQIDALENTPEVTDMLESSTFPTPQGWEEALDYAMNSLARLPRSKISVSADVVEITAISDSPSEKRRIEADLARRKPDNIKLVMNITSPRPVITPFTLRLTLANGKAKFDACSAGSDEGRSEIVAAAIAVGLDGKPECAIGLGIPSPTWPDAAVTAIQGLKDLGGGTLTMSDADISLVALDTTSQSTFDRVVGDVEAQLPELFSLHATLPEKIVVDGTGEKEEAIEFIATFSPEGSVQLRGRLGNDAEKTIIGSYARAQFGSGSVYLATRNDDGLPATWSVRVLAALQALGTLEHGSVIVQPDYLELRGVTGSKETTDNISRLLGDKLGDGANFDLNIRYDELLDPTLNIPTPEECVLRVNRILLANKIVFEPSSSDITEAAGKTIDMIGEVVSLCDRVRMEIGAHSDSQGRESMNLELSEARAQSVLQALIDRRVRTRALTARGYGETIPVADNKTEEGREINRRIEFKLLTDARTAATQDSDFPADAPLADTQNSDGETPETTDETPSE
jgi:OOP family OmpA-OmpF porin